MQSAQGSGLAPFLGDWSQSEKFIEIEHPLVNVKSTDFIKTYFDIERPVILTPSSLPSWLKIFSVFFCKHQNILYCKISLVITNRKSEKWKI